MRKRRFFKKIGRWFKKVGKKIVGGVKKVVSAPKRLLKYALRKAKDAVKRFVKEKATQAFLKILDKAEVIIKKVRRNLKARLRGKRRKSGKKAKILKKWIMWRKIRRYGKRRYRSRYRG